MMIGQPLYWRNEISGKLEKAVLAYFEGMEISIPEILILRAYFAQWIKADYWEICDEIEELRQSVDAIASTDCLNSWLEKAVLIGIDPL
jgi:hypothetical protein